MNFRLIAYLVAVLLFCIGLSMTAPLGVALYYGDGSAPALLGSLLLTCGAGGGVFFRTRGQEDFYLSHRDGVAIVTLGWLAAGLAATLPYLLSGAIPDFTNAYFESISGLTTTGSSIFKDVEVLPQGILFWRAQTQWLGGMGIIVLSIAILPFLGIGGMQLYKAETPSPVVDKLTPRISDTAQALWKIYIVLTIIQIFLLMSGGMDWFDSICHTFATMPTGGFSPKNASVGHYQSVYIDFVIVLFMFVAGMNFSLHYKLVKGNVRQFFRDPEFRSYLFITAAIILVITIDLYGAAIYKGIFDACRYAAFQVVSIMTTTGFVTADFEQWPVLSQQLLLLCMFLGSMAGSTGGGIKIMRIVLLLKHCYLEIFRIIHPHATTVVKLGEIPVPQTIMRSIWGFFLLYVGIYIVATVAMAALGLDMISSISAVATCLGNVGPGLGSVGPMDNFSGVPVLGKWLLIFCMLLGRLEIYTIIVLLMPGFWRK
ncbi:MAG TPA: TrkH family potassium uptake protein [Syntrophales bacterium]|nr:TrkH family potassium uptake protein [Syntrophales bacterium]HOD97730.1 TrkH family potassium uptake protein [Syntrophales bacterium]HOH72915.1 TrkH family potassium uptake protein [Syntrophales bacterium]HPX81212.1 TrkH family potassium uptake protein [Syntrophales bacterium]HQB13708.1 TrkH family potassium uptake protein [Syntrophales bacterium]